MASKKFKIPIKKVWFTNSGKYVYINIVAIQVSKLKSIDFKSNFQSTLEHKSV